MKAYLRHADLHPSEKHRPDLTEWQCTPYLAAQDSDRAIVPDLNAAKYGRTTRCTIGQTSKHQLLEISKRVYQIYQKALTGEDIHAEWIVTTSLKDRMTADHGRPVFAAKGDSGAALVKQQGQVTGIMFGALTLSPSCDVTY